LGGKKGEPIVPKTSIIDMIVVRGLSVVRSENFSENEYHKYVDIDDMGLVIYTPKILEDPSKFVDPKAN
jgi:hypothetical protein